MRAGRHSRAAIASCLAALVAACGRPRDVGGSPPCQAPLVECAGACLDVRSDAANCGACGAACLAGQVCEAGGCAYPACPAALRRCGAQCVDLLADEANCGACGVVCAATRCHLGACPGAACAGVLGLPGPPALATGPAPVAIAAGDLDGDGFPDLLTVTSVSTGSGEVRTFLGFGFGAFEPGAAFSIPPLATAGALGQIDPAFDSSLDLAVAIRAAADGLRLFRGDGTGAFTALPAANAGDVGADPVALLLADVDGDGDDDLLVGTAAAAGSPNVRVLLNDGTGTFGSGAGAAPRPADHSWTVAGAPNAFAVADVDADSVLDLAVAHDLGLAVLYLTASGTLRAAVEVPTPRRPAGVAVAYVDTDGWLDLAAADPEGNGVFLTLAAPGGTAFAAPIEVPAGVRPRALVAADLDLDGRGEIVVADEGGGTVTILRNTAVSGLTVARTSAVAGMGPVAIAAARLDANLLPDVAVADSAGNASVLLADGAGSLVAPRAYRAASGAALALFHADGGAPPALDAALADWAGDAIVVRLGNGDGTFGAAATHALPAFGDPAALAAGDVDRDGAADLAVALRAAGKVALLWGDGAGGFSAPALAPAGGTIPPPSGVALADLDGGGGLDLLVTSSSADELVVLLATGVRGFDPPWATTVCADPSALAVGRLDADARDDVAIACAGSGELAVLLRDPARPGKLLPARTFPAAAGAGGVALADLDGDGNLDVAVSAGAAGAAVVLWNDGAGGFDAGATFPACAGAAGIAAGDVTGDGIPDLAVACPARGATAVLRGLGGGAFAPPLLYPTGGSPRAVALGDLDGDGAREVVSANDTPAAAIQGGGLVVQRRACVGP